MIERVMDVQFLERLQQHLAGVVGHKHTAVTPCPQDVLQAVAPRVQGDGCTVVRSALRQFKFKIATYGLLVIHHDTTTFTPCFACWIIRLTSS